MAIYKNDYKKSDDKCLWEIHEIRHKLHAELQKETYKEINEKAKLLFNQLRRKYSRKDGDLT